MFLIHLAWKNLWRNTSRTLITISAVFFAIVLSVLASSLKTGIFERLVDNVVGVYTGYIQIHSKGYWQEPLLDNGFQDSRSLRKILLAEGGIISLAPRLESFALISNNETTKGALVVGIEPLTEDPITHLSGKLKQGRYLKRDDTCALLADGLARGMNLHVKDTLVLISQGYHGALAAGKFIIGGIVHFGSPAFNEKALFLSLPTAQQLFSAENIVTSYVISPSSNRNLLSETKKLASLTGKNYEVISWEDMLPDIRQHIKTDSNNMFIIQCILYILISFGIFSTLLMLMEERRFELGMLVALGLQKSQLALLLFLESVFTVITGCVAGILVSIPIVRHFHSYPILLGGEIGRSYERFGFEAIFPTSTDPKLFVSQAVVVLCIGMLLSLYPVYKVLRLNPVHAMRK
jgi:putative ABC transport system permease protein